MKPKERVKDILENGLINHICYAEAAYNLGKEISRNAEKLNENKFGNLFSFIQNIAYHEIVLSITKIYEPVKKNYKVRSIPSLLDIISENKATLEIIEKYNFCKTSFLNNGEQLYNLPDLELNELFLEKANASLPSASFKTISELSLSLKKLKLQRDKSIAHCEFIDITSSVTFKEILGLIDYAKKLIGAVGWGYLSTVYEIDNKYILTSRSSIIREEFRRLLQMASIISDSKYCWVDDDFL